MVQMVYHLLNKYKTLALQCSNCSTYKKRDIQIL